jgi:phage host-nuclease inhibitor protein Gam
MYYKLEGDNFKTIKRAEEATCTDYDLLGNFIPVENMITIIEDLLLEIDRLEEKMKDTQNDIENNYELKNVNPYEEYGVSEKDFY